MKLFRFFVCLLFILSACTKDAEIPSGKGNINEIETVDVTSIMATSVIAGGKINVISSVPITQKGICWGTTEKPTISNFRVYYGAGNESFNRAITGLLPGTNYYLRAYLISGSLTMYGEQMQFRTKDTTPIVTATAYPNAISTITASSGGTITSNGGKAITARGVCWSTTMSPTINNSKTSDSTGVGSYSSNMTGLSPNTTYYVRAYATNELGTSYGPQVGFTTRVSVATLNTVAASSITASTASAGGSIVTDGGSPITSKGVCWSTSPNPTINNSKTSDGTGAGSFTSSLTGLTAYTTYYVRAYAINAYGVAYGAQIQFTTSASVANLTTTNVYSITTTTATSGGTVTSDGGSPVTARGICWSTSASPTISNNKTSDGTGTGSFASSMTGLSPNTTYYVRAYATNAYGTAYGAQMQFTTTVSAPSVTTTSASSITMIAANTGGTVTSDGGNPVIARGVCWSIAPNPTTSHSKTNDGTGTGSFISNLTSLSAGLTYYVRAYAINSYGTSYGQQIQFTTPSGVPLVGATTAATNITTTSAYSGGTILSDGGSYITSKGLCWSTTPNPTISNSFSNVGMGAANFSSIMTNLSPNTTYYVRAFYTNSYGTGYGAQISFKTNVAPPNIYSTTAAYNITTTTASSGGNITSDGGNTITARGVCWSTDPYPTISNNKTTDGGGTGSFTSSMTGLSAYTTYYVRSYATTAHGTTYGPQIQFTTISLLPVISSTTGVYSISRTSAYSGGLVASAGSSTVTARGVCWSTTTNPTISDRRTINSSGVGSFTSVLTTLSPNTTYYVRAYATNAYGTVYGPQVQFRTSF